ncbi:methyl-accepting chemotaxis protein [Ralstonia solanacearum]|nr:methyl-accepting chemotaxis protein [Ralstonia solanacearum]
MQCCESVAPTSKEAKAVVGARGEVCVRSGRIDPWRMGGVTPGRFHRPDDRPGHPLKLAGPKPFTCGAARSLGRRPLFSGFLVFNGSAPKMRISTRLGLGFAVLVCFLLVNSCVGWMALSGSKQQTNQIVEVNNQKIALAYELQGDLNEIARAIRNYILYTDKGLRDTMASRMAKNRQKFEQDLERIRSLMHTAAGQQLHDEVAAGKKAVFPLYDNVVSLVNDGKSEDAVAFLAKSVQSQQDTLFGSIRTLLDRQVQLNGEAVAKLDADYALTVKIMATTAVGSVVLGLILALRITRSITGPLDRAVTLANAVAEGDLTHRIEARGTDEIGELLHALGEMTGSLTGIVGRVRSGTQNIASATSQIAAGNLDLSSRTEQQASSLEETASSMEELTSTVKQNAENAQQANALAANASTVANKGRAVVDQVVGRMSEISDSSSKIAEITSIIESIAFQTNILALNAAVEAARAGEQGRGFAVVAGEVRTLAQRSSSAAKEIRELIAVSVEKVQNGSRLVDEAGRTMSEVTQAIERVTRIMSEIAEASSEQSRGIEQVNQAVTQMDEVTQQNAALVEQAAAAASSLQEQGQQLSASVAFFRLNGAA